MQAAGRFLLRPATIVEWMERAREEGENALVSIAEPVDRFPDFVRYIVNDKDSQFDSGGYRDWCDLNGIDPRYAAAESIRATAVIERFFLSLKEEWLRRILVPLRQVELRRELSVYFSWFEPSRPHQGLGGRTPKEVYDCCPLVERAKQKPTEIPRVQWVVHFHEGRRQLPIVELRRVA